MAAKNHKIKNEVKLQLHFKVRVTTHQKKINAPANHHIYLLTYVGHRATRTSKELCHSLSPHFAVHINTHTTMEKADVGGNPRC